MVIDGGADYTTLGMNWLITYRYEHAGFSMRDPMELGDHVVAMDKSQGLTQAQSTNGPVLLRVAQSIRVKQGVAPPEESLIKPDQLRCIGIKVHDVAHCHGGLQCMVIPVEDGPDVIIPFTYTEGNFVILNELPTEEDKDTLPIYDITGTEGWNPRERPTEHFDMSLYDEALPQRRNSLRRGMDPVVKHRWMEHMCITD